MFLVVVVVLVEVEEVGGTEDWSLQGFSVLNLSIRCVQLAQRWW